MFFFFTIIIQTARVFYFGGVIDLLFSLAQREVRDITFVPFNLVN